MATEAEVGAAALVHAWVGRSGSPAAVIDRIGGVDQVGVNERVEALRKRSIKKASKVWALDLTIRMMDLTTLEGKDTEGKVRGLCAKGIAPEPGDPSIPHVAAICVYPAMIPAARDALKGSGVKVASVATGFPSGQTYLEVKLTRDPPGGGGRRRRDRHGHRPRCLPVRRLRARLRRDRGRQGGLRPGAPQGHPRDRASWRRFDNVRRASILAMAAGADFIKTSTGKVQPAATLPVTLVMLEAIRDFHRRTGRIVGMKPAGGIRTAKEAISYLVVLYETLGPRWMTPDLFRFGASSLLNDVLQQLHKERTGHYSGPDYVTLD